MSNPPRPQGHADYPLLATWSIPNVLVVLVVDAVLPVWHLVYRDARARVKTSRYHQYKSQLECCVGAGYYHVLHASRRVLDRFGYTTGSMIALHHANTTV